MKEAEINALCNTFDGLMRVLMDFEKRLTELEDRVTENGG